MRWSSLGVNFSAWIWIFSCSSLVKPIITGFIRVGFIFNKNRQVLEDVIRLQIKAKNGSHDLEMTLDEAVVISAGLTKVAGQMLSGHIVHGEYHKDK